MKTSLLKMSVPVFALGFVLTSQVDTQAYPSLKVPAFEEQQRAYKWEASSLESHEKKLDALEQDLESLIAELDGEETISFEQYQKYQSTLDGLIQELSAVSKEIDSQSPTINQNFKELLVAQEKMHGIDVK